MPKNRVAVIFRNRVTLTSECWRHCGPTGHTGLHGSHDHRRVNAQPETYRGICHRRCLGEQLGAQTVPFPVVWAEEISCFISWWLHLKANRKCFIMEETSGKHLLSGVSFYPVFRTQSLARKEREFGLLETALPHKLTLWFLMVKIAFCCAWKLLFSKGTCHSGQLESIFFGHGHSISE